VRHLQSSSFISLSSLLYCSICWRFSNCYSIPAILAAFVLYFLSIPLSFKGTVQRDFLPPIFSQMDFSQAPYSVFKDFSNLASNSRRYSRFLIDSPLLFIAESWYSPYCLVRRVATLRFIIAGSHYLLELSAWTLAYRLIRRVDTSRIVYYGESLLPASFIAESHCWQRRVILTNSEGLPLPLKGQ
jgi:hypothetical protein